MLPPPPAPPCGEVRAVSLVEGRERGHLFTRSSPDFSENFSSQSVNSWLENHGRGSFLWAGPRRRGGGGLFNFS